MDIEKLGCNIRLLREGKGLTREQFCEGEKELSVRQLMRIEKGESTPTLAKLVYIADKLGISVTSLFNESENTDTVPQEYWYLKNEVENYSNYENDEKDDKLEKVMKIYDLYYDILPLDEQLFVDCMLTLNDVYESLDTVVLNRIIEKYNYVLEKDAFSANEMMYLSLYFIFEIETQSWKAETELLIEKILMHRVYESRLGLEVATRVHINIVSYYWMKKEYQKAIKIANDTLTLMTTNKTFKRMPIIYMLLAKCYIGLEKKEKGKEFYQKALELAELLQFESLKIKIQQEKDKDVT